MWDFQTEIESCPFHTQLFKIEVLNLIKQLPTAKCKILYESKVAMEINLAFFTIWSLLMRVCVESQVDEKHIILVYR